MAAVKQGMTWLGLWGFWVWIARNNHPTLPIDGIATALLLAVFAAAVYFNWLVLVPRYWQRRRFVLYWTVLLLVMSILTALGVWIIQIAYDVLWGPDPKRFGFWVNYGLDFTGMSLHLLGAAVVFWFIRRNQGATV